MNNELSPLKRALRAVDDLQAKLDVAESGQREPIAVVGVACRFPGGASTPRKFWELIRDGVDAVRDVPQDRWNSDSYYDPDANAPGKMATCQGGFIDDAHGFDAQFFGISAHMANGMDPQQRLLFEVTWEALENAGISPDRLEGSQTGVYMGLWSVDYWQQLMSRSPSEFNGFEGSNTHSLAAGYISYLLNLKGPCLAVDTACSTSLVTIHLACQSLRHGDSDIALAGGVNLILSPLTSVVLSKKQVLAPDGRCKSFDAAADGFGRGEGCGVVVLKRLSDARADGDRILALVRGTAINQDGRGSDLSVPNASAQKAVIRKALQLSNLAAAAVHYVEAHGTGTSVGDPIELSVIGETYGEGRPPSDPLRVGSVKTNIGHLETASGVAGFIKALLSLQHEAIPANLHFHNPNPKIPWDRIPVSVPTKLTPWPRGSQPRFAAVSSFGISGTNAHLILQEPPLSSAPRLADERPRHLLTLSAKTEAALIELAGRYESFLGSDIAPSVGDICWTANTGRRSFGHRLSVTAASQQEMRAKLAAFRPAEKTPAVDYGRVGVRAESSPVAFMFTGQGSQYAAMGQQLYQTQPTFRQELLRCDGILQSLWGESLLDILSSRDTEALDQTRYTQPALFALEYALAQLIRSWGIEPRVMLGHSVGEYVAACLAGVFSLEDGLRLISARAKLMQQLPRDGSMAIVFADESRVAQAIAHYGPLVDIAAVNGPANTVISGNREAVQAILQSLQQDSIESKSLNVSHAFHSALMEPMMAGLQEVASKIEFSAPQIPLISNVTGDLADDQIATAEYWVKHVRRPVRFAAAVATAHQQGFRLFLEIGPQPALAAMGRACLSQDDIAWLPTLCKGKDDWQQLLESIGTLFVRGAAVDWRGFDQDYPRRKVELPSYPFQRQRYCIAPPQNGQHQPSQTTPADADLLADGGLSALLEQFNRTGSYSQDELELLKKLLGVFAEEHQRRQRSKRHLVAEYYNAIPNAATELIGGSREEQAERFLTFGPFPDIVPGFSWVRTFFDPDGNREFAQLCLESQKEMRAALFRSVDFSSCSRVLDFGCGYGSDLISLAKQHDHLELAGYTIADEQAEIGQRKVREEGLQDRLHIYNRDSSQDQFPGENDLVFGFEVAHHIRDKHSLFANVRRSLKEEGRLVLADFVSRAGFAIEHEDSSSFFVTHDEWVQLLSENRLLLVDCIDISTEISNFLYDPEFNSNLDQVDSFKRDANIRASFKSYDQLGKLLRQGLAEYVLLNAIKREDLSVDDLTRLNHQALRAPQPYSAISLRGCSYELEWRRLSERNGAINHARTAAPQSGAWLILADHQGLGAQLAERLEQLGQPSLRVLWGQTYERTSSQVWQICPSRPDHYRQLMQDAFVDPGQACLGIVHLWSLDTSADDLSTSGLGDSLELSCASALHLLQAWNLAELAGAPRLWCVTRDACPLPDDTELQPQQAPLLGLGKTFALEHPDRWGGMLDLSAGEATQQAVAVVEMLADPDAEFQYAYREGKWHVPRLVQRTEPQVEQFTPSAGSTYLITGGLGALGIRVASWLADRGARHLVLTSRHASSKDCDEQIRRLQNQGVTVRVADCDVSDLHQVERLLADVCSTMPPLKGVIHAAGVLDDGVLLQQDWEKYKQVMSPKVEGAWNLHRATLDSVLDFFVCFSSAASLLGSPGQGNYAAANSFLDTLTYYRQARGLPALTVNWGAWAETGMAAELSETNRRRLSEQGLADIDPPQGLRILGELLVGSAAQVGVVPMQRAKFLRQLSGTPLSSLFSELTADATPPAADIGSDLPAQIREAATDKQQQLLVEYVDEKTASVLGFRGASGLDRQMPLLDLGCDSLMAIQLRNAFRNELRIDLEIGELFSSASIEEIAQLLHNQLAFAGITASRGTPETSDQDEEIEVF